MNEIHFEEEQLKDTQSLAATLFAEDASDPRSWNYKRKLIRPQIRWGQILIFTLLVSLGIWGVYWVLIILSIPSAVAFGVCAVGVLATLLFLLKRILIFLIQVYQLLAPEAIRNKCRFEPSCSQYMILALQKFGLRKGLHMGIDRLKRCNANDGGFDYP